MVSPPGVVRSRPTNIARDAGEAADLRFTKKLDGA